MFCQLEKINYKWIFFFKYQNISEFFAKTFLLLMREKKILLKRQ